MQSNDLNNRFSHHPAVEANQVCPSDPSSHLSGASSSGLPSLQPQPRRLFQPIDSYAGEPCVATPLHLASAAGTAGEKTPEFGLIGEAKFDVKTPEPEQFFLGKDGTETPNVRLMTSCSVQNTPEHLQYGSSGIAHGTMPNHLNNLMHAPPLNAVGCGITASAHHQQLLHPVFPHTLPITPTEIGQVPTPMSNYDTKNIVNPNQIQMQAYLPGLLQGMQTHGNMQQLDAQRLDQQQPCLQQPVLPCFPGGFPPQAGGGAGSGGFPLNGWPQTMNCPLPAMNFAPQQLQQNCPDASSPLQPPWYDPRIGGGGGSAMPPNSAVPPNLRFFSPASAASMPGIALGISAGPVSFECPPEENEAVRGGRSNNRNKIQLSASSKDVDEGESRVLQEIRGHVAEMSRTQVGSKYLQRELARGSAHVVESILSEMEEDLSHLMCDQYANYLCSAVFHMSSVYQRIRTLKQLRGKIEFVACDKRGTHALQTLIGLLITTEEQSTLMQEVQHIVFALSMDGNGTHVVQKLLGFQTPITDLIYRPVVENLAQIADNPYGLCVLKECISQAVHHDKNQNMLLSKLACNAVQLVQSPFGNYAVQHALDVWGGTICKPILMCLQGFVLELSVQKFSSNVVEKILTIAPPDLRTVFIDELSNEEQNALLVRSAFGHYVARRALKVAEPPQVAQFLDAVRGHVKKLTNRHLRSKWDKLLDFGKERLSTKGSKPLKD